MQIGEEAFPFRGAFRAGQAKIDDLLLAVMPQSQGHQDRALERAGAGLAGKHHAVEHQRPVAVGKRAPMERGHRCIERLGDLAHRCSAHLAPEQASSVSPTLRVDSPSTKPARITRSISRVRRA